MTDTVLAQVAALKTKPIKAPKNSNGAISSRPNRRLITGGFLEHRLAYRIQELAYGGLKPETVAQLR